MFRSVGSDVWVRFGVAVLALMVIGTSLAPGLRVGPAVAQEASPGAAESQYRPEDGSGAGAPPVPVTDESFAAASPAPNSFASPAPDASASPAPQEAEPVALPEDASAAASSSASAGASASASAGAPHDAASDGSMSAASSASASPTPAEPGILDEPEPVVEQEESTPGDDTPPALPEDDGDGPGSGAPDASAEGSAERGAIGSLAYNSEGTVYREECGEDNCGIEDAPAESWRPCEAIYQGDPETDGEFSHYQCYPGDENNTVKGPVGQECQRVTLYDENKEAIGEGADCTAKGSGCVYDADWEKVVCEGKQPPPEYDTGKCGKDDCGLRGVPRGYDCEQSGGNGGTYQCEPAKKWTLDGPGENERCTKILHYKGPNAKPRTFYECKGGDYERGCIGVFYDKHWKPVTCVNNGGGQEAGEALVSASDETGEAVRDSRDDAGGGYAVLAGVLGLEDPGSGDPGASEPPAEKEPSADDAVKVAAGGEDGRPPSSPPNIEAPGLGGGGAALPGLEGGGGRAVASGRPAEAAPDAVPEPGGEANPDAGGWGAVLTAYALGEGDPPGGGAVGPEEAGLATPPEAFAPAPSEPDGDRDRGQVPGPGHGSPGVPPGLLDAPAAVQGVRRAVGEDVTPYGLLGAAGVMLVGGLVAARRYARTLNGVETD